MTHRSLFTRLAAGALAMLAVAAPAAAQRGDPKSARIFHGGANDTGDGYSSAWVDVRYQFADCVGDVAVLYAMDRESINVGDTYHYRGKSYNVPRDIGPPRLGTVVFSGPILNNVSQIVGSFSDPYTQGGAGAGCLGQSKVVFSRKSKLGESSTQAEYQAFLQTLWIQPRTQPRLRNSEVEAWIGRQLAQQRDDSLKKVADRDRQERDRKARADSVERARQLAADRDRRAADSAATADRRRADDDRSREEADDRAREWEQAATDARNARENEAMVAAQSERMRAMYDVERMEWDRAEAALARGDIATARPIYEKLAGSLVYGDQARARLEALDQQVMAEGVIAAFQLMGQAWNGLKAIHAAIDGSGITLGGTYAQYGLPVEMGSAGFTFSYISHPMQSWVPFVDFNVFGLGGTTWEERVRYYPHRANGDFVLGTTLPKLKLALGSRASLSPHVGVRYAMTDLRGFTFGQSGLLLIVPGLSVRGDVILINGKPQLGAAIGRIF